MISTKTLQSIKDKELEECFNNMLGVGVLDPHIIYPKYLDLIGNANLAIRLLNRFTCSVVGEAIEAAQPDTIMQIKHALVKWNQELAACTIIVDPNASHVMTKQEIQAINTDKSILEDILKNKSSVPGINTSELNHKYNELKNSSAISSLIQTYSIMRKLLTAESQRTKQTKHNLADNANLLSDFITEAEGYHVQLFSFSNINFKSVVESNNDIRRYVLALMSSLYALLEKTYDVYISPDVDKKKFCEVIISALDKAQSFYPGCNKAFDKLRSSVDLLDANFDKYYVDFVISKNSSVIFENFILDTKKSIKSDDRELISQFNRIMNKIAKNKSIVTSTGADQHKTSLILGKMQDLIKIINVDKFYEE
jgi:hypothetical protein